MFQVAVSAPLCPFKATVQPLAHLSLLGNTGVTPFATLGLDSLEGGMALVTVVSKIGMGEKSAKFLLGMVDR